MTWNAKLIETFLTSFFVCAGAACIALSIGLVLAILTRCYRVPGSVLLEGLFLTLIFVPLYVQATAWSAGFGLQGWFRLSQVAAAISPFQALFSVIWIYGAAASPICYLLCSMGITRAMDLDMRQALTDFGPGYALTRFLIPKLGPWVMAGGLLSVALTGNDMVVTNLFQVPTLTESLYQQVQFNELRADSIVASCTLVFVLGVAVWLMATRMGTWLRSDVSSSAQPAYAALFKLQGLARFLGSVTAFLLVGVVVVIPLTNLVAKAGWVARVTPEGTIRSWSLSRFWQSLTEVGSFRSELAWGLQLSFYATALAVVLAWFSVWMAGSRRVSALWIASMAMLLATPGPLINLIFIRVGNMLESGMAIVLIDRTLFVPILALQSRCWPIAFGLLWVAEQRFRLRHAHLIAMDRGLPLSARVWIRIRAMRQPILICLLVCFFVSFAELSCYLLVLPPGVTTVSMRMFDLLHYGVKNQDASLALVLAAIGFVTSRIVFSYRK